MTATEEQAATTDTEAAGRRPPQVRWGNARVLWSFVRPHRRVLLAGLLLGLGATLAQLATPMVTKHVLDGLGTGQPTAPAIALLVGLLVAGTGFALVQWTLLGRLAERVVLDARSSMVHRLLRAQVAALSPRSSGELTTSVTSDTLLLRGAAATAVVDLVNGAVLLVGALILMGLLDWVLLAATLSVLAVLGAVVAALMPSMALAQRNAQAAVGRFGGALEGTLRAVRTVKAGRAESRQGAKVLAEAQESARQNVRAVRVQAVAWTVAGGGLQFATLLVLALGAWRVTNDMLAVSSLVAFLLYAFQIMEPVTTLTHTVTELQSGVAAAARIRAIEQLPLERGHEETSLPRPVPPEDPAVPVVTFRDVTARHQPDGHPALSGVSFALPRHCHTAIVGPSGAGKTTLFSLMLGFLQPQHGEVTLDGTPLSQWPLDVVRGRMVYVEQDAPLICGTLRENLTHADPDVQEGALWSALAAVHLADWARGLADGLETNLSAGTLSGGERQRVALARALVSPPEILLLDEVTAQLDGLTETAVQGVIRRVAVHGTVLTIAHRLSTVIDADRILLLDKGRLHASGTHRELLSTTPLYRALVGALRIPSPQSDGDVPASPAP